jgi:hypothetical protein
MDDRIYALGSEIRAIIDIAIGAASVIPPLATRLVFVLLP